MFSRFLVLASGFRTSRLDNSGMDRLFQQLSSFSDLRVEIVNWDADPEEYSHYVHRHCTASCRIYGAGHSWGCGEFLRRWSFEMESRGRVIDHLILADAIYRRSWAPNWWHLLPSSLWGNQRVRFSPVVQEISWFFQRRGHPMGDKPTGAKVIHGGVEVAFPHEAVDDSLEFHEAVMNAL